MEGFDSIIYGSGMKATILNPFFKKNIIDNYKELLNFNSFFKKFSNSPEHSRIVHRFYKLFSGQSHYNKVFLNRHRKAKKFWKENLNNIKNIGVELFFYKELLKHKENQEKISEINNMYYYSHLIYNYWHNLFYKHFVNSQHKRLSKISEQFKNKINYNIYITTNYNLTLDKHLNIEHLHGKFVKEIKNFNELGLTQYKKPKYERERYHTVKLPFIFQTIGFYKLKMIEDIINKNIFDKNKYYNFDFFLKERDLGNLLIYGLNLTENQTIKKQYNNKTIQNTIKKIDIKLISPNNLNKKLISNVEGHIINQLEILYKKEKIKTISIAYYAENKKNTNNEIKRYRRIFDKTIIPQSKIYLVPAQEVFDFSSVI
jgi:hypothetical protein